jgi:hypothetical protein
LLGALASCNMPNKWFCLTELLVNIAPALRACCRILLASKQFYTCVSYGLFLQCWHWRFIDPCHFWGSSVRPRFYVLLFWFLVSLLTLSVAYIVWFRITSKQWTGSDLKGSGNYIILCTILSLSWKDWGNLRKISVRRICLWIEIRSQYLQIPNMGLYPFGNNCGLPNR